MNSLLAVNALTVAMAPNLIQRRANDRALGQTLAAEVARSGMMRLACRSGSVPPARAGNVNVNPLRIVAKAGVDGSRADRESCSQESTTAGGSSRLSLSRLVRCPCYGLHFLCVAKSTQR
jgi:hypothetical protein